MVGSCWDAVCWVEMARFLVSWNDRNSGRWRAGSGRAMEGVGDPRPGSSPDLFLCQRWHTSQYSLQTGSRWGCEKKRLREKRRSRWGRNWKIQTTRAGCLYRWLSTNQTCLEPSTKWQLTTSKSARNIGVWSLRTNKLALSFCKSAFIIYIIRPR